MHGRQSQDCMRDSTGFCLVTCWEGKGGAGQGGAGRRPREQVGKTIAEADWHRMAHAYALGEARPAAGSRRRRAGLQAEQQGGGAPRRLRPRPSAASAAHPPPAAPWRSAGSSRGHWTAVIARTEQQSCKRLLCGDGRQRLGGMERRSSAAMCGDVPAVPCMLSSAMHPSTSCRPSGA